jgi:hypothetical protein
MPAEMPRRKDVRERSWERTFYKNVSINVLYSGSRFKG